MGCKNCSDITLLSGTDGVGIQTIVNNGDGTFTIFMTDGSTFLTADFDGAAGAAATIAVGAVTTGAPGTAPTVTNTGSPAVAVFAFQFPIGIGHDTTLFVDLAFGNNGTALRERIDLPYLTIAAAITVATSGDTVHIRAGSYTEDITLKNGVNIYCEEGVIINGRIIDAGVTVVSLVSGHGILVDTDAASQCINITGPSSDIEINMHRITTTGIGIYQAPSSGSNKLLVKTDILSGNIVNYFVTARGEAYCTVIVSQYAESAPTSSNAFAGVDVRGAFSGEMNFKCSRMVIGTSTNVESGRALSIEGDTTSTAKVFFEVDTIINNYEHATASKAYGTLNANGHGKYIIKVKDCYSKTREGLVVGGTDVTGTPASGTGVVIFEGMIFSRDNAAFRMFGVNNVATTTRAVIRNSSLMRGVDPIAAAGVTTADRNSVIIFGDAGFGTTSLFASNYMNAEFIDTQIIKNVDITIPATGILAMDPSVDNAAVCIQGANNFIYFKGCDVVNGIVNQTPIASFCAAGFSAADTLLAAPATTDLYFKDTHSNRILKTVAGAINETNSDATGFVTEATARTLNYLHTA